MKSVSGLLRLRILPIHTQSEILQLGTELFSKVQSFFAGILFPGSNSIRFSNVPYFVLVVYISFILDKPRHFFCEFVQFHFFFAAK